MDCRGSFGPPGSNRRFSCASIRGLQPLCDPCQESDNYAKGYAAGSKNSRAGCWCCLLLDL